MDLLESVRKKSAEISFVDTGPVSGDYIDETIPLNKNIVDVIDPVDALSANREQTMVVAAGCRGVLKVFKVSDDGIQQVADLRSSRSRKLNLLYSPSNVAWSKLKDDLIATTSTNGAVVLWNMTKAKIDTHYKWHQRSATVVHFHHTDENLVISGSKDATVYMYDLRKAEPTHKFGGTNSYDVIRDLSFFLHSGQCNQFITSDDSGTIRLWDTRRQDKPVFQFPAHHGYAASIAINPREHHLIASGGGRDKFIKVWDCSGPCPSVDGPIHQVETMAPVGRVYWSPDHHWQIVSCAVVNDMNVHIWDIRRPFLPYASFEDHRDSVTDVWWSAAHPERFVSCGKDGLLVLHYLEQKQSPLTYACDVAVDISPDGLLGVAANSHYACVKREKDVNGVVDGKTLCKEEGYDPFRTPVRSQLSCGLPDSAMKALQPTSFFHLAQEYLCGGRPLRIICNYNANLAMNCGQEQVAQTWRVVAALIAQAGLQEVYDEDNADLKQSEEKKWKVYQIELERQGKVMSPTPLSPHALSSHLSKYGIRNHQKIRKKNNSGTQPLKTLYLKPATLIASWDFYFGTGELRGTEIENDEENPYFNDFNCLQEEAFNLKDLSGDNYQNFPEETSDSLLDGNKWDPMTEVARLLHYHAEQGDVQSCATIALVCGRLLSNTINDLIVEAWMESYISMLDQLDLHIGVASFRKFSWIRRINQRSLEGTHHRLFHRGCAGHVSRCRCSKCDRNCAGVCEVCNGAVLGMVLFCRNCHHSFHPQHALDWFKTEIMCPVWNCLCSCNSVCYQEKIRAFGLHSQVDLKQKTELREIRRNKRSQLICSTFSIRSRFLMKREMHDNSMIKIQCLMAISPRCEGSKTNDNFRMWITPKWECHTVNFWPKKRLCVNETQNERLLLYKGTAQLYLISQSIMPTVIEDQIHQKEWENYKEKNITYIIELDLKQKLLRMCSSHNVKYARFLIWIKWYNQLGKAFMKHCIDLWEKNSRYIFAHKQAYELLYQYNFSPLLQKTTSLEIPNSFSDLQKIIFPLGPKKGPLTWYQARYKYYLTNIAMGVEDENEICVVNKWEERSIRREGRGSNLHSTFHWRSLQKKKRDAKASIGTNVNDLKEEVRLPQPEPSVDHFISLHSYLCSRSSTKRSPTKNWLSIRKFKNFYAFPEW